MKYVRHFLVYLVSLMCAVPGIAVAQNVIVQNVSMNMTNMTTAVAAASAAVAVDTVRRVSLSHLDTVKVVTFDREVFQYSAATRRDPFVSLLTSDELRPLITDLRLTTVAYDQHGRGSVAVLRDLGTKAQYRVKLGSPLGRMRVVRIDPKSVTFVIEEFGYSRQETLAMGDSTDTRKP